MKTEIESPIAPLSPSQSFDRSANYHARQARPPGRWECGGVGACGWLDEPGGPCVSDGECSACGEPAVLFRPLALTASPEETKAAFSAALARGTRRAATAH